MFEIAPHYTGRIVDAHHHYWDLHDGGHYPWLQDEYDESFFLGDYERLRRDFLPEQYRAETAGYHLVGDVHVEAERSRSEQLPEDAFLRRLHDENGTPTVIVGHVGFLQPDRDDILAGHAEEPLVRGIRSKPVTATRAGAVAEVTGNPGTLQDPAWLEGLAQLERFGFSWDLRVPAWHLSQAAAAVRELPDIPVILNHCGLPLDRSPDGLALWRDGMRELADLPQVTVKVSELGLRGGEWNETSNQAVIRDVIDIFGWDRAMFASNLPVSSLAVSFHDLVGTVIAALPDATPPQLDRLFAATANRVYRMDLQSTEEQTSKR